MHNLKYLALAFALLFLCACSQLPQRQLQPAPQLPWRAALQELAHWQLEGKAGLQSKQSYNSLTLTWLQQAYAYQVQISGPLGQGQMQIEGTPELMLLSSPEGRFVSEDPAALLLERTGWPLPINELPHWVKGLAAPGGQLLGQTFDEQGRLLSLEQNGWQIEYQDYLQVDQLWLPRKLQLRRDDWQLKLVIKDWQLANPS
ncbi:lipoprotein insertase outer membrane protein LolB [Balneatrix alpica]|uniref:lipoprotein insertase outer membrane protein LolB n=1 Tax=Balneatrix alpica TaxID=75684 RepID=UPI002739A569|nr:lipoprotein insertase outer membrane protein LolB [Balneatrix alpica]